ncbi:MAG TPA: dephospho-CoA kinase [Rhodocyclaceae bacterium]|nr:dephospho-CoA kinase [Rhodocyclaceae bacterium]
MTSPQICRVIGLTGGIGSGKSAAAAMFGELGAAVVDVDNIAHELTAPSGLAIEAIRQAFGDELIAADGALDRSAMRQRIFGDAVAKSRLEAILHPMIGAESLYRCETALASGAPYVMLVVPLLVESGTYRSRADRIAVVDCAEETQITRVMSRSGLARTEIERIMATQASRTERLAIADDIIDNNAGLAELRAQVTNLHRKYLTCAIKKY